MSADEAGGTATTLVCPRDKVETVLTCNSCGTPICPKCYVRSAVGLRCPSCAAGVTVKLKGARPRWLMPAAIAGVVAVVVILIAALAGGGGSGSKASDTGDAPAPADQGNGGAATGYKLVDRKELGYSVQVPFDWLEAADNTADTTSYAKRRAEDGSLRVTINRGGTAAAQVQKLMGDLQAQGGTDFKQSTTQLNGVPTIRLDYRFPINTTPGAALSSHITYLVEHNGAVFSVQLATTDPSGNESVFNFIASTFKLA